MRDGQRVQYIGPDTDGLVPGEQGKVLSAQGHTVHVKWATGSYGTVYADDLLPLSHSMSVEATLDDSLEVGGFEVIAARDVYEEDGPEGLLNRMASTGRLAVFDQIAQDVLASIEGRLRQDPVFMSVVGSLDDDEADTTIRLAAVALVRDAFVSED